MKTTKKLSWLAGAALLFAVQARAETVLKVAVPQKGLWDTSFVDFANREGFFKPVGLDVQVVYTQGGAQSMQALLSGSVDAVMAAGMLGIIGAYSKGAPLRVMAAEMTGVSDAFWMTRADSPIHSLQDLAGKDVGFSEAGSASHLILLALLQQEHVTAHPVAVGSPPDSLTMVMSGQIPASWSAVPMSLAEVNNGTLRIIARSTDAKVFQNETIRANITTASVIQAKKEALDAFNKVYVKTIDWAYSDPRAIDYMAEGAKVSHAVAEQTVHGFISKASLEPYEVRGLESALQQAADFHFTPKLLSPQDVAPLFSEMMRTPS